MRRASNALNTKSTNPFDSSDEESQSNDVFHDCVDEIDAPDPSLMRTAPLDFNFQTSPTHEPALDFDIVGRAGRSTMFTSPLASALTRSTMIGNGHEDTTHQAETPRAAKQNVVDTKSRTSESFESPWSRVLRLASGRFSGRNEPGPESRTASVVTPEEDQYQATPVATPKPSLPRERNARRRGSMDPLRSSIKTIQARSVLEKLEHSDSSDVDATEMPWTKMILLEELGTASSWAILILPYLAFVVCLVLDTHSALVVTSLGPLDASSTCLSAIGSPANVPMIPSSDLSCSYPFALEPGSGLLVQGRKSYLFQTYHYGALMSNGTAFASGPIRDVSPLSAFLNGDATFSDLPLETMGLVANGRVLVSAVVLQRSSDTSAEWVPVFIAKPERLSMSCVPADTRLTVSTESRWNCTSPRIIDVYFPMPGTGVLSVEELVVNVLFSVDNPPPKPQIIGDSIEILEPMDWANEVVEPASSFVYLKARAGSDLLSGVGPGDPGDALSKLVRSSSYHIELESPLYREVKIGVRLFTMALTMIFSVIWCWSLGMKGFFASGNQECCLQGLLCCAHRSRNDDELPLSGFRKGSSIWWDSPWIVFPERRYLLLLLLALILIQNPVFALAYFRPSLYGRKSVHRAADSIVGIGLHLFLLVWLCLLESLRYHTAAVARRRAKYQRQVLELRRVAKYMAQTAPTSYGTDDYVSRYTSDYYERYGDVDGSGSAGMLHVRLFNDPCSENWSDFLLPKLALFALGAFSVTVASSCRYPTTTDSSALLSPLALYHYNVVYAASSICQLCVLMLWAVLVFTASVVTGRKLRKEPFLSTRPAQLAYRILLGITILGFAALLVPFASDLMELVAKWTVLPSSQAPRTEILTTEKASKLDVFLRLLVKFGEKLPYSGTAASIGPGKLLLATVCALITSFAFLPSRPYLCDGNESERAGDSAGKKAVLAALSLPESLRHRRDKRTVVSIARYTKTWRVFPLPIKKLSMTPHFLSGTAFYLDPTSERSIAYFGRYTPVFCLELACWLLEASWQAYYSPTYYSLDDWAPGRMSLDRVGLSLEHFFFDQVTETQVFIASNTSCQVDGEDDSIIVVAFRGTASSRNVRTDLKSRIVPLPENLAGIEDEVVFRVFSDRIDYCEGSGSVLDDLSRDQNNVKSYSPHREPGGEPNFEREATPAQRSLFSTASRATNAIVRATPMARRALPCVHAGFLEAYLNVRRQVLEGVLQVYQRQLSNAATRAKLSKAPGEGHVPLVLPKIYITGHSLGGALGQLLALDIANNCEIIVDSQPMQGRDSTDELFRLPFTPPTGVQTSISDTDRHARFFSFDDADNVSQSKLRTLALQPPIAVYTYGQTRVGNKAFARLYKQRVPHTFRVANERDAFTTLPTPLLCGGRYKHAGLEVVLDEGNTGNTLVGPTVVETLFRFSRMRTSVAAHSLERYRDCLASALRPEELEEYYRGHGTLATREKNDPADTAAKTTVVSEEDIPSWLTQGRRSVAGS